MKNDRFLGCHVSISGGFANGIRNGEQLGVNTIQVHPCSPQRWNFKPFADGFEDEFLQLKEKSTVKKVFFHGIYLINLANPDPKQFGFSKTSLIHDLNLIQRVNAEGLIFHVGNLKHSEDEMSGLNQAADGINYVLNKVSGDGKLLLEVSAGAGTVIGSKMEQLREVYEKVEDKSRVGFALDTQHMWASGYDLKDSTEEVVNQIEKIFSFEKVFAVHLNDSKTTLASKVDRHANLGEGEIGWDALARFVNHPKIKNIPCILETPALKSMDTAAQEVLRLKELCKN